MTKSNRTVIIANHPMINNFDVLGCALTLPDGTEVRFHDDPVVNIAGTTITSNFDLFISDDSSEARVHANMLDAEQVICLPRYDKMTQAIRLLRGFNDWSKENSSATGGFKPLDTWFVGPRATRNFPLCNNQVVVKPRDGARGIGQFVVSLSRVNLQHFIMNLREYITSVREKRDNTCTFDQFIAQWQGMVSYHTGTERSPDEGLFALLDQGMVVQSLIPNVASEWRIITGFDGVPVYCQRRVIKDPDSALPQATGAGNLVDYESVHDWEKVFASDQHKHCFLHLCKHVIGPMNSIDLFLTENNQWGIFEYCNQFGVAGIPVEMAYCIHHEFIQRAVNQYLGFYHIPRLS